MSTEVETGNYHILHNSHHNWVYSLSVQFKSCCSQGHSQKIIKPVKEKHIPVARAQLFSHSVRAYRREISWPTNDASLAYEASGDPRGYSGTDTIEA